jgi:ATP-dependent helicase/nuclease subunit A
MIKTPPPDQIQRDQALDPARSILVQAPAGSGKTTLLTERFLALLAEVDEPGQVVAITFTIAAAAEMRNRILDELRNPEPAPLARRALERSNTHGWKLLDLPAQLRISTIDGFCRELALQQPLLSGLGGGLAIAEQPDDLYRRAARQTLQQIDSAKPELSAAIEALLLWRDNNRQELEEQLVEMLKNRDRWMQGFLIDRDPDWDELRQRLERPFANAIRESLIWLDRLLDQVPGARDEALKLARFACEEPGDKSPWGLAECAEIPTAPFQDGIESAREAFEALAAFLQIQKGTWRSEKGLNATIGFPPTSRGRAGKSRLAALIARLAAIPGLESALASVQNLPPLHYTEDDWKIVKACFTLLGHAAAELQVVFAEAAAVDFTEVAQIALHVMRGHDGLPTDAAIALGDGIRHLLVDEFQDTSRRQHQLLAALIASWPDPAGRTCFAVGDPMQSIYFFREADTELFARVKKMGLELPNAEPLTLDLVPLSANFRTTPTLVRSLNEIFAQVFAADDGSGVTFSPASPARASQTIHDQNFELHIDFAAQTTVKSSVNISGAREAEGPQEEQVRQIVELIRGHQRAVENARAAGQKYRIAVLARARKSLTPIAQALREAGIPFRAVELEKLATRPEVLDALALARALLNPHDRVAWLGVLRAPWCGLALDDLHLLASADDPELLARPIPDLLAERLPLLGQEGRKAADRILEALSAVSQLRSAQPTSSLGTLLQQVWLRLGGAGCVDAAARANLDLLWSCLDGLPGGEQDLLSPALNAALDKLTALPDPSADSGSGVQLMTIHKSKGLEFEVVIVPELEAGVGGGKPKMLSWLERGLPEPDDSGEITEFLIAPQQTKGADKGGSKAWVDRVYRERETQEDRRILYVAATRARDELHLFARPAYKIEANGDLSLCEPSNSLLATAWPALEPETRSRFEEWKASSVPDSADIASIAAAGDSNLLIMPSPIKPTLLRRLPPDYRSPQVEQIATAATAEAGVGMGMGASRVYARHEGGLLSRALGTAVHTLFEELARQRATSDWPTARAGLRRIEPRIAAQMRASGMDRNQAAGLAAQALRLALDATNDPTAQWILSPHADSASEAGWVGVVAGALTTVRVDRIFRAGLTPASEGQEAWWIIDYKTAHADVEDPAAALPQLRRMFAPQIETYAQVLCNLHGKDTITRAGLYYPRMLQLDWWEL